MSPALELKNGSVIFPDGVNVARHGNGRLLVEFTHDVEIESEIKSNGSHMFVLRCKGLNHE